MTVSEMSRRCFCCIHLPATSSSAQQSSSDEPRNKGFRLSRSFRLTMTVHPIHIVSTFLPPPVTIGYRLTVRYSSSR